MLDEKDNPMNNQTFGLGLSEFTLDDAEKQRRRRLAEGLLAQVKDRCPGLTVEEVEEMMY